MTAYSYRDHIPLKHRGPIDNKRPEPTPGTIILGNAVRHTYRFGDPVQELPWQRQDAEPLVEGTPIRPNWKAIVAGIAFALAAVELLHLAFGIPGVGVLFGGTGL